MSEQMGIDALPIKTGTFCGALTCCPEDPGRHRATGCVPGISRKQPLGAAATKSSPVVAQMLPAAWGSASRRDPDSALASMDVKHHPTAINIFDLQMRCFGAARTSGIECHQHRAMKAAVCRIDQAGYFFRTEDLRQVNNLPRIRCLRNAPALLQHLDVEEAQRSQAPESQCSG